MFAMGPQDVLGFNDVVTSTLLISSFKALVLFDSGATHSFVSLNFVSRLNRPCEIMVDPLIVNTPLEETYMAEFVYKFCAV